MCGRYYIADQEEEMVEMRQIIDQINRRSIATQNQAIATGEISPTMIAPVIANSRSLKPTPFAMRWGYTYNGRLIINTRSETVAEKPMFRNDLKNHRCLIPASWYFEWGQQKTDASTPALDLLGHPLSSGKLPKKTKYAIGCRKHLIYIAGIYRKEADLPVYSILTRSPADPIAFIHDRMPVILGSSLGEAAVSAWLDNQINAQDIIQQAVQDVVYKEACC